MELFDLFAGVMLHTCVILLEKRLHFLCVLLFQLWVDDWIGIIKSKWMCASLDLEARVFPSKKCEMKIIGSIFRYWIPSDVSASTHFFLEGIALED